MTEIIWYGRGGQGAFTAAKLLGAVSALSGIVTADNVHNAIEGYMPEKIHDKNKQAVSAAAREVCQ